MGSFLSYLFDFRSFFIQSFLYGQSTIVCSGSDSQKTFGYISNKDMGYYFQSQKKQKLVRFKTKRVFPQLKIHSKFKMKGQDHQSWRYQLNIIQLMSQGLESKKQQFKTFLERTGAIEQISKIMVKMLEQPQKPSNALKYILDYLGVQQSQNADSLLKEFEAEQLENIRLRAEIAKIKKQIDEEKGL